MAEDLEQELALAFAPPAVDVRHAEIRVFCASCGVEVSRDYPTLGWASESRQMVADLVGKSCSCGQKWADSADLAVRTVEISPEERGFGYCLRCKGLFRLADLESWLTGLRCRGCKGLEAAMEEFEANAEAPWHVHFPESSPSVRGDAVCIRTDASGDGGDRICGSGSIRELGTVEAQVSERRYRTALGDSREVLKTLADNSVDAMVTDPPAGVGIFGKDWDCFRRKHNPSDVGRDNAFGRMSARAPHSYGESDRGEFVAYLVPIFQECLRVIKPGGFGAVWALPKTSHWTAWALEEAGWGIVTPLYHHFSQGMPKHRSQIKPSTEMWWLVRKPTSLTYEENERQYGVGSLQIDACRIARAMDDVPGWHYSGAKGADGYENTGSFAIRDMTPEEIQERCGKKGRWPSDALFSHDSRCVRLGTHKVKGCPAVVVQGGQDGGGYDIGGQVTRLRRSEFQGYGDEAGMEELDEYACVPSCPVRLLDSLSGYRKSGKSHVLRRGKTTGKSMGYGSSSSSLMEVADATYGDEGGISRCFTTLHYCPKTAKSERNAGLFGVIPCEKCGEIGTREHVDPDTGKTQPCILNGHSTVKPLALMRWLCRLCCIPGGQIVDPFMGSGSTGCAAVQEGFNFLGIERDERSYAIARARLAWVEGQQWK